MVGHRITFTQSDSPLDDLCDLSLPVSHTLLLRRQVLKIVLQLTILSRQFIHKRTQLRGPAQENCYD